MGRSSPESPDSPDADSGTRPRGESGSGASDLRSVASSVLLAFGVALVGFLAVVPVGFVLVNVLLATGVLSPEPSGVEITLLGLVSLQGIAFPLVASVYLRLRGLGLDFLRVRTPSLRQLGVVVGGVVAILVLVTLSQVVVSVLGVTPAERTDQEVLTNPEFALVGIPLMLLIVGPGEELLFRGVVQSTIRETTPAPVAIVLANVAFAPAHLLAFLGAGNSLVGIVTSISLIFLPGVVFGVVYEYTDNLVVPALAHGLWNSLLLATVLLGAATGLAVGPLVAV
ncbi:CPBP family intramembrane metalloprotease [Halobacteriales archaeon SW_12_71_31]|nr:MAG: CPBP family intramembrane metalloprotease [Halobacteriales archaeon SW_12_71_31]